MWHTNYTKSHRSTMSLDEAILRARLIAAPINKGAIINLALRIASSRDIVLQDFAFIAGLCKHEYASICLFTPSENKAPVHNAASTERP